jgi:cold shock CspA family protein/ribosome-associated translation inhibitor RaiA
MKIQPHVVYRGFGPSAALTARITEELADLERIWDRITGCHVSLELPHRHKRHGKHFLAKIELYVPGKVLSVGRDPSEHEGFEDAYAAVNESFSMLRRQLREYVRAKRGRVKKHEKQPVGVVTQLLGDRECGFLRSEDGRDVYFHRNSVLGGGWQRLKVGSRVAYAEESGDEGPQASTVRPLSLRSGERAGVRGDVTA